MTDEIVDVVAEFCTTLRMRDGIDEPLLARLRQLMSSLHAYPDDAAERIRELAAELSDEVSAIFFGRPG